jgi:hypothetical protein
MITNKQTYNDYPFDETPAWQMKLDHEFAYHFGDITWGYMMGQTTAEEFAREVMEFRGRYTTAFLQLAFEDKSVGAWYMDEDSTLQEDLTTETNSD